MKHLHLMIIMVVLFVSCKQEQNKEATMSSTSLDIENGIQKNQEAIISKPKSDKENKAVEIALEFINKYIKGNHETGDLPRYLSFVNSSNLTTINFKEELKKLEDEANKLDPEMGLGFDPIVDAQDYPDEGFEFETFDKDSDFLIVKGKNWADFKVTIKVVFKENNWFVDGSGVVNIPKGKQCLR